MRPLILSFRLPHSRASVKPLRRRRPNTALFLHLFDKSTKILLKAVCALFGLFCVLLIVWRFFPPISTLMAADAILGRRPARDWRPLERISPHLARAVLAAEDGRFCDHGGVDWIAFQRVWDEALQGAPTRGASTLPMQVSKNLFLWPSRSIIRKSLEIPIALSLNAVWSKRRILEVYLNIAEWGPEIYGAEAAAQRYFHKSADRLSAQEAALLATALPNPLKRRPDRPSLLHLRLARIIALRARGLSASASYIELK